MCSAVCLAAVCMCRWCLSTSARPACFPMLHGARTRLYLCPAAHGASLGVMTHWMVASLVLAGPKPAVAQTSNAQQITSCAAGPEAYLQRWRSRNSVSRWDVLGRPCTYMLYQVRHAPGMPCPPLQAGRLLLQLDGLPIVHVSSCLLISRGAGCCACCAGTSVACHSCKHAWVPQHSLSFSWAPQCQLPKLRCLRAGCCIKLRWCLCVTCQRQTPGLQH